MHFAAPRVACDFDIGLLLWWCIREARSPPTVGRARSITHAHTGRLNPCAILSHTYTHSETGCRVEGWQRGSTSCAPIGRDACARGIQTSPQTRNSARQQKQENALALKGNCASNPRTPGLLKSPGVASNN